MVILLIQILFSKFSDYKLKFILALIKLLKEDPSAIVRQRAAEAISLLSDF